MPATHGERMDQAAIDLIGWDRAREESFGLLAQAAAVANRWRHAHWEGSALRSTLLLTLSAGRWEEANAVSDRILEHADLRTSWLCLPDVIEARVRHHRLDEAKACLQQLEAMNAAVGSAYLLAVIARCQALVGSDPAASFARSITELSELDQPVDAARTRLLLGEWLRQNRRPGQATIELTRARAELERLGCHGLAERAERALSAGLSAAARAPGLLTTQEYEVATRATDGKTNAEIAGELFLSKHTVDYHLRKVFQKLSVTSRRELRNALERVRREGLLSAS